MTDPGRRSDRPGPGTPERGFGTLHRGAEFREPLGEHGNGPGHSREHLALVYESREEQFDAVVPFVRDGLERDEHCLYIADERSRDEVLEALRDAGVDVDPALESGLLRVETADDTYLRGGSFDLEESLTLLEETLEEATAEFEGFRVTVEETWLLRADSATEDFMTLEARVNELFRDEDCLALCQYNRERFPPDVIRDVIRTHPHLVYDDRVNDNVYYTPPEEFLGAEGPAAEVERKLGTLEARTRSKQDHQRVVEALEAAREGISLLDDDGEFIYVNDAYADTFGYEPEEMVGEHWDALGIESDPDYVYDEVLPAVEREGQWTGTTTCVRSDDSTFLARHSLTQTEDGEIICVIRDVTEREERERELERALDLLERTERIADVGGWEVDPETKDVYWTDQVFELLGVTDDEEPSLEGALEMYHEDDRADVEAALEAALEAGEPFDLEARIRTEGGEVRWLRLQGVPETADGEVVSVRGAAQDVTERERRERRLEELIERLEESNERLEQFAYAASHDLQEPLRMVSSYLQLLERRYEDALDEDGREFLEFAVDGADRMREMIDGLLAYSRVETQGDPLEPTDLDPVLEDVLSDLRLQIEESDAEITVEDLPYVEGDASQLRQVFQNLLENAITYSGDGPPRVHVSAERDGSRWVVAVEDEGIGIEPEETDAIFEVFQRLHSREEHPGTGIGLALCRRILERHGGDIWVDSEPGEGSTFYVSLPDVEEYDL